MPTLVLPKNGANKARLVEVRRDSRVGKTADAALAAAKRWEFAVGINRERALLNVD